MLKLFEFSLALDAVSLYISTTKGFLPPPTHTSTFSGKNHNSCLLKPELYHNVVASRFALLWERRISSSKKMTNTPLAWFRAMEIALCFRMRQHVQLSRHDEREKSITDVLQLFGKWGCLTMKCWVKEMGEGKDGEELSAEEPP
ncbi:hypothetical protein JRQ81_018796 [Phrynocephalus forsythii]|uniref:Uncharacterized protein n=1 Tax=Phrynocephalus forsythii TaxID=171643 RepID=A0A9Q0XQ89_9SAUR|nr:hypothetical protein JRQ81_018796 [Phrynocephalus forsythii]